MPSSYKSFLKLNESIKYFNKFAAVMASALPVVRNPERQLAKYS